MNERRIKILQLRAQGEEMGVIASKVGLALQKAYREMEIARALLGARNDCHAVLLAIEEGFVKTSVKIHP